MKKRTSNTLIGLAAIGAAVYLFTHNLGDGAWWLILLLFFLWD